MTTLGEKFPFIRIISLPERRDRRAEIVSQLSSMNIRVDGYNVGFLEGQISQNPGSLSSASERGRFLAHLLAIDQARRFRFSSILILEDDVLFSLIDKEQMGRAFDNLSKVNWDIFYGGSSSVSGGVNRVALLTADAGPERANFVALSKRAIEAAVPYFTEINSEESNGPSTTELVYASFRAKFTDLNTFCATPKIVRRSSSLSNREISSARNNVIPISQAIGTRKTGYTAGNDEGK